VAPLTERTALDGLTERLATWVAGLQFSDLPPAAIQTAVECILDSLGVGVVGASLPVGAKLQRLLDLEGRGNSRHTVIGSRQRASATWAAFVNGCLMHAEDWDDTPHTTYYLPALLVTAEELDSSGAELVTAWVAAYEIWTHLIPALDIDRQHNPTSVIGPMVAALGAGYLHRFSAEQLQTSLAIGAASSAGLRANFGTLAKPMDAGNSARAGVQAVTLTRLGWTAERKILEGLDGVRYKGVFDSFGGVRQDPSKALDGLGVRFRSAARPRSGFGGGALDAATWPPRWTPEGSRDSQSGSDAEDARGAPTIKAWPACFGHNAALTALFSLLHEPGFDRGRIASIELLRSTDPTDSATFRSDPTSGLEAKFSVPFVMAAAWLDGDIDINTFRQDNFERICRSDCMHKIHIVIDRSLAARGESGSVTVNLKNGSQRRFALGRGLALRGAGVVDKFLHNATPLLGPVEAQNLADRVMHLDHQASTRALIGPFATDAQQLWPDVGANGVTP
jgi:2-methylcitrate dehydratase PrpD